MPPERAVGSDQTDIEARSANAYAGEKINAVEQRATPLYGKEFPNSTRPKA